MSVNRVFGTDDRYNRGSPHSPIQGNHKGRLDKDKEASLGLTSTMADRNLIIVQIGQIFTQALIDTWSQLALASLFKSSQIRGTQENPDFLLIWDVGGRMLLFLG